MKRQVKRVVMLSLLCAAMAVFPAIAGTVKEDSLKVSVNNAIFQDTMVQPRGTYISSSTVGITNKGSGVIGITASTTAHQNVDKIRIHIYLDKLVNGKWNQVDDYDYTFLASDQPNGELSSVLLSFEVTDQPANNTYRVRGAHGVWKNGVIETQDTDSDGVYISSDPVYRIGDEKE